MIEQSSKKGVVVFSTIFIGFFIMGLGCVQNAEKNTIQAYSEQLDRIDRANTELLKVEEILNLSRPIDVRWPSHTDPMWWFVYLAGECRIEIAANAECVGVGQDISSREGFYYTGYFWVGSSKASSRRGMDEYGRCNKTFYVGGNYKNENDPICKYLMSLDMLRPIGIDEIQKELGLKDAFLVDTPAFVSPMFWFVYEKDGKIIGLGASKTNSVDNGEYAQHPSCFVFNGYWRMIR